MIYKQAYWYFSSVLTPRFCNELINYANHHKKQIGLTGSYEKENLTKKDIKNLQKKRKSNLVWLDDAWIYKEIIPYVQLANKTAKWNFSLKGAEACQFTEYNQGEYYDWHHDQFTDEKEITRKLSVTCNLSKPEDYEGGELEFGLFNPNAKRKYNFLKCEEIKPQGSIVVFPSFLWHRVTPVTKGKRNSLVIWSQGDRFK